MVGLLGPSRLVLLVRGALPGEILVARLTAFKKGVSQLISCCVLQMITANTNDQ
jgi:hypothetical protein